jgi:rhodanese-related sulfurtransferase
MDQVIRITLLIGLLSVLSVNCMAKSLFRELVEAELSKEAYGPESKKSDKPANDELVFGTLKSLPDTIKGGKVISTRDLRDLLINGSNTLVVDAGPPPHHKTIPYSLWWRYFPQKGSYSDEIQQHMKKQLEIISMGDKKFPVVFHAVGSKDSYGYNAALRAINLGYENVYWYRGGEDAWDDADLPLLSTKPPHRR